MNDPGWVVEPRPVSPALEKEFEAPPFNGIEAGRDWVSLADKIGAAKMEELYAIFGGNPVDPSTR